MRSCYVNTCPAWQLQFRSSVLTLLLLHAESFASAFAFDAQSQKLCIEAAPPANVITLVHEDSKKMGILMGKQVTRAYKHTSPHATDNDDW